MSTLPRPTGKELVRALERAGFVAERVRGSHYFIWASGRSCNVVPLRARTLGLGLLRKILSDCGIKPQQLSDLL